MRSATLFAVLLGLSSAIVVMAECPNACSGHGTCGANDMCTCDRYHQAADCSERTCPYGYAHVTTPKGDLNMDGDRLDNSFTKAAAAGTETISITAFDNVGSVSAWWDDTADTDDDINVGDCLDIDETTYCITALDEAALSITFDTQAPAAVSTSTAYRMLPTQANPNGDWETWPGDYTASVDEGHFYMECSNRGLCTRKTGQCSCFDGWSGWACNRASCPNDCSGHGTCESIAEMALLDPVALPFTVSIDQIALPDSGFITAVNAKNAQTAGTYHYATWSCAAADGDCSATSGSVVSGLVAGDKLIVPGEPYPLNVSTVSQTLGTFTTETWPLYAHPFGTVAKVAHKYDLWDADLTFSCKCDPSYEGYDCSKRSCPKGDDPLSVDDHNEIQTLDIARQHALLHSETLGGTFTLTFTDEMGAEWTTSDIVTTDSDHDVKEQIQAALLALPNNVITQVTVSKAYNHESNSEGARYHISFSDATGAAARSQSNSGNIPELVCDNSKIEVYSAYDTGLTIAQFDEATGEPGSGTDRVLREGTADCTVPTITEGDRSFDPAGCTAAAPITTTANSQAPVIGDVLNIRDSNSLRYLVGACDVGPISVCDDSAIGNAIAANGDTALGGIWYFNTGLQAATAGKLIQLAVIATSDGRHTITASASVADILHVGDSIVPSTSVALALTDKAWVIDGVSSGANTKIYINDGDFGLADAVGDLYHATTQDAQNSKIYIKVTTKGSVECTVTDQAYAYEAATTLTAKSCEPEVGKLWSAITAAGGAAVSTADWAAAQGDRIVPGTGSTASGTVDTTATNMVVGSIICGAGDEACGIIAWVAGGATDGTLTVQHPFKIAIADGAGKKGTSITQPTYTLGTVVAGEKTVTLSTALATGTYGSTIAVGSTVTVGYECRVVRTEITNGATSFLVDRAFTTSFSYADIGVVSTSDVTRVVTLSADPTLETDFAAGMYIKLWNLGGQTEVTASTNVVLTPAADYGAAAEEGKIESIAAAVVTTDHYWGFHATGSKLTISGSGTTEEAECSNRGLCDYATGLCKCFKGYTLHDCSGQNALSS